MRFRSHATTRSIESLALTTHRRGTREHILIDVRNPDVDAWLMAWDNPMRDVVAAMRETMLAADDRVTEKIAWNQPTFMHNGMFAGFVNRATKAAVLMFMDGSHFEASHPGLIAGNGKTARQFRVASLEEADARKGELEALVRAALDFRDR